jgi:hypothetical protein
MYILFIMYYFTTPQGLQLDIRDVGVFEDPDSCYSAGRYFVRELHKGPLRIEKKDLDFACMER